MVPKRLLFELPRIIQKVQRALEAVVKVAVDQKAFLHALAVVVHQNQAVPEAHRIEARAVGHAGN